MLARVPYCAKVADMDFLNRIATLDRVWPERVLDGLSVVPDTFVPQWHPLADPAAPSYAYDPEAGSALLEEVGVDLLVIATNVEGAALNHGEPAIRREGYARLSRAGRARSAGRSRHGHAGRGNDLLADTTPAREGDGVHRASIGAVLKESQRKTLAALESQTTDMSRIPKEPRPVP